MNDAYELMRDAALASGTLLTLHLDVTARCPLRCRHCYMSEHAAPGLSTVRYEEILEQGSRLGALFLLVSGGEPLVRPDLLELLGHARRLRYAVTLNTTARGIDSTMARALARLALLDVGVSVYSGEATVHDGITQRPGSFEETLRGIRELRDAGVAVRLKTMVMPRNAGRWQGVVRLAEELGAGLSIDASIFATDDGDMGHALSHRTAFEEKAEVAAVQLRWNRDHFGAGAVLRRAPSDELAEIVCGAGRSGLYVAPSGEVYPCMLWRHPLGDLTREDLGVIWTRAREDPVIAGVTLSAQERCSQCLEGGGLCPGMQQQETGSPIGHSSLVCERNRAWRDGLHVVGLDPDCGPPPPEHCS